MIIDVIFFIALYTARREREGVCARGKVLMMIVVIRANQRKRERDRRQEEKETSSLLAMRDTEKNII